MEQAIHSVDKVAWAFNDKPPVSCVAVGGRQIPAEGRQHLRPFRSELSLPEQRPGVHCDTVKSKAATTRTPTTSGHKGSCTIGRGPLPRIEGQNDLDLRGPEERHVPGTSMTCSSPSIRKGEPINDGERMATSTMLGIMGRMAAYTGQTVTWDQAMNSQEHIFPDKLDWNGKPARRSDGPIPGVTKLV